MKIKTMSLGPLGTNCYIVHNNKSALIFDPGGDANKIIDFLESKKLIPQAILLTHAHFDHIGGVESLRTHFNIDVYLHNNEAKWLSDPALNRSIAFTREEVITKEPEFLIKPGEMNVGSFKFSVIHTPGHSPGSVSFIFSDDRLIISGDVLFEQGIGRTDLPEGSLAQLEDSIYNHLYKLPDHYVVYPGHGGSTTIGSEKLNNPYVPA